MAATHAAQDEVFRQLEQPQHAHLLDDVRRLGHHAHVVEDDETTPPPTETTPLIVVRAGHHRVAIDGDVDLEKFDQQLRHEEQATFEADRLAHIGSLWKEEAAGLFVLSVPITLVVALEILPPILVSMMIGQASGAAAPQVLAGSSLSDFFQGQITQSVLLGLSAAVSTMCAQSFGAGRFPQLWIYAQAGMLACVYALVPLAVLCFNGAALLTLLGQERALAEIAGVLIAVSFLSLPFQMVYTVARSALQAQNIAAPFVIVSVLAYAVGLPLGYYLGNYTSLGYVGIALSNAVSNSLRALAVIPILLRNDVFRQAWPGWQWREANALVRRLWHIGAGSVLMVVFLTAGFYAIVVLCGYLVNPAVVMSANNIAQGLISLAFIPMMAISAGGTVRVGNALGAGQPRRASIAASVVFLEALVVSLVGMFACWYGARGYASDFTSDDATVELATQLVEYLTLIVPLVGTVYAAQAVFQACGAQWLCAQLNFLFLFAVGVPLGWFFAIPEGAGVFGLWEGNYVGGGCLVIVSIAWVTRIDWPKTAHEARLNAHLHVDHEPSPEASTASTASSAH